jgi:peptidylprolyl isomerase domain and WD repeat-containing protein 1
LVVSADSKGLIEVWDPKAMKSFFTSKLSTDLFAVAKAKGLVTAVVADSAGDFFCVRSSDGFLRVFQTSTGKVVETISDPEPPEAADLSQSVCFDETSRLVIFSTRTGIQVYDISLHRIVNVLGSAETSEQFTCIGLYQGPAKRRISSDAMASEGEIWLKDPTLICGAFRNSRVFLFSRRLPDATRDVFNETFAAEKQRRAVPESEAKKVAKEAILQTTAGDITIQLFASDAPKTVENFATHSRSGYFNGCTFHRVIKGFMVQTGDPTSTGSGDFGSQTAPSCDHHVAALPAFVSCAAH